MKGVVGMKKITLLLKEAIRKFEPKTFVVSHCRRFPAEILNVFITHDLVYKFLGIINKRFGFIESIFLAYPASDDYSFAYLYAFRQKKVMWDPWLCGLFFQNGKFSLMFCVTATNEKFVDSAHQEELRDLYERIESIRNMLCAKRKSFAGILPGTLFSRRIIRVAPEADLTAMAVVKAIATVTEIEKLGLNVPIIILGGKGFIGRRVVKLLDRPSVYSIDKGENLGKNNWPDHLNGKPIIVVNITLAHVIDEYIDVMWPDTIVLNEVYPEPSQEVLSRLRSKNCNCYHIVGVEAVSLPAFPSVYSGAIPCCAAWPSSDLKVVLKKIN